MNNKSKNEKLIELQSKNGDFHRFGTLVKVFKYTKSKYKYKIKIAPKTYIYAERFEEE